MIISPEPFQTQSWSDAGMTFDAPHRKGSPRKAATLDAVICSSPEHPQENQLNSMRGSASSTSSLELSGKHHDRIDYLDFVQVVGLEHKKLVFSHLEFSNIRREFSRKNKPLVLVSQSNKVGSAPRFIYGPDQLKSLGGDVSQALANQEVTILLGSESEKFIIPRKVLRGKASGLFSLEAILGSGDSFTFEEQPGTKRCYFAAMLESGALGICNAKMAASLFKGVPQEARQDAATCALYGCIGSGLTQVGQVLLDWGADPHGTHPDDDFGMLQHAVVNKDVLFIELLLRHGADPFKETETCISALDYAELSEFMGMKQYFTGVGKA